MYEIFPSSREGRFYSPFNLYSTVDQGYRTGHNNVQCCTTLRYLIISYHNSILISCLNMSKPEHTMAAAMANDDKTAMNATPMNIATISAGFEKGDFLVREEQGNRVYFDFFEEVRVSLL